MKRYRYALAFTILFSVSAALGQDEPKKPVGEKPKTGEQAGGMAMPKPAPELERMAKMMLGTWTVNESHEASEMGPAGTSKGTSTFKRGPGGFSIVQTFNSMMEGQKFEGHGITWWDPKEQAYRGVWCDSMTPKCDASGTIKWEGEKLVGSMDTEMPDGKQMRIREEFTDIKPNSFTFNMYTGDESKPSMVLKYTRKAGTAATKK